MALKATEGFDHYNAQADLLARSGFLQWTQINWNGGFGTPGAQGTGGYVHVNQNPAGSGYLQASLASNLGTIFLGHRLYLDSGANFTLVLQDLAGGKVQIQVVFTGINASVTIQDGNNNTLATSASNVFSIATWFYMETGLTVDPTSGSVDVHVNGTSVVSYTGNTKTSTNAWVNGFKLLGGGATGVAARIDDLYLNDNTTGPGTYPCNSFLGDVRVFTRFPTANAAVAWTPLANSNFQEVNETAMDSDTSYNTSSTAGQADLFDLTSIPTDLTAIIAVNVVGAYKVDQPGPRTLSQEIDSQGTIVTGASKSLNAFYVYYQDIFATDPATGVSWTYSNANALTAGYVLGN